MKKQRRKFRCIRRRQYKVDGRKVKREREIDRE